MVGLWYVLSEGAGAFLAPGDYSSMNEREVRKFLEAVKTRSIQWIAAVEKLRQLPYEDLGFAKIDHHRSIRQGFPEVIFARKKTPKQVKEIVRGMLRAKSSHNILITHGDRKIFAAVKIVAKNCEVSRIVRRHHYRTFAHRARQGPDPGRHRWHQRHSRRRGSSGNRAHDGPSRRSDLRRRRGRTAPPARTSQAAHRTPA